MKVLKVENGVLSESERDAVDYLRLGSRRRLEELVRGLNAAVPGRRVYLEEPTPAQVREEEPSPSRIAVERYAAAIRLGEHRDVYERISRLLAEDELALPYAYRRMTPWERANVLYALADAARECVLTEARRRAELARKLEVESVDVKRVEEVEEVKTGTSDGP